MTTTTNVWIAAGTDTDGQRVVVHGITEQDAREAMIDYYEYAVTIDTVTEIATADGIGYEEGSTVYWYDPDTLRRVERTF